MKKYAIIVAGGEGNRAGGSVPKQFQLIHGIPMLWWSVRAFHAEDHDTEIIIVMHPGFFDDWDIMHSELPEADRAIKVKLVCGGRTRCESVSNGLNSVDSITPALVAIHDAARPLIDVDLIFRGWNAAKAYQAAVPVIPVTDSLRKVEGIENRTVARKDYVKVQTPQVFAAALIKAAYANVDTTDLTDDASVAEAFGKKLFLFEGSTKNIKVTNPEDFRIASVLMQ